MQASLFILSPGFRCPFCARNISHEIIRSWSKSSGRLALKLQRAYFLSVWAYFERFPISELKKIMDVYEPLRPRLAIYIKRNFTTRRRLPSMLSTDQPERSFFLHHVPLQKYILSFLMFLPSAQPTEWRTWLFRVSLVFLSAGWISTAVQFSWAALNWLNYLNPAHSTVEEMAALNSVVSAPFTMMNLRAVIVPTIFLFKQRHTQDLLSNVDHIIQIFWRQDENLRQAAIKWRRQSFLLFGLTSSGLILTETFGWYGWFFQMPSLHWESEAYAPLFQGVPLWSYFVMWQLFHTIPFFVSQQICLVLICIGNVLTDCTRTLNNMIENLTREVPSAEELQYRRATPCDSDEVTVTSVGAKRRDLELIFHLHSDLVQCCESLNAAFSGVFLAAYATDMLVMLTSVMDLTFRAEQQMLPKTSPSTPVFNLVNCLVYGSYANLFLIPHIRMYEQVKQDRT